MVAQNAHVAEDGGSIFLTCDTVLNLLLKVMLGAPSSVRSPSLASHEMLLYDLYYCSFFVQQREELQLSLDASLSIDLLKALTYWAGKLQKLFEVTFLPFLHLSN